jgi:hypothetical protein
MPGPRQKVVMLAVAAATSIASPGAAVAASGGGAMASQAGIGAGGVEYGTAVRRPDPPRATRFEVGPRTITAPARPRILLRVDADDGPRVQARIVFTPARGSSGRTLRITLVRVRAGRVVRVAWPRGKTLRPGRYVVRLHATDADGRPLQRRRRTPGRATLTVKPKPKPKPAPVVPVTPAPVTPPAVVPATGAGIFPVRGPHSFGDGFGVGRPGHLHQGVDIPAAQGTPIVSPTAGTIRFTDFQASAAGEYVVERLADGRDIFLAHCVRHSTVVRPGQVVAAGARLCDVGSTGDSSGPHLHFELWPQGWRDVGGTAPVDPLPQLRRWDAGG